MLQIYSLHFTDDIQKKGEVLYSFAGVARTSLNSASESIRDSSFYFFCL